MPENQPCSVFVLIVYYIPAPFCSHIGNRSHWMVLSTTTSLRWKHPLDPTGRNTVFRMSRNELRFVSCFEFHVQIYIYILTHMFIVYLHNSWTILTLTYAFHMPPVTHRDVVPSSQVPRDAKIRIEGGSGVILSQFTARIFFLFSSPMKTMCKLSGVCICI